MQKKLDDVRNVCLTCGSFLCTQNSGMDRYHGYVSLIRKFVHVIRYCVNCGCYCFACVVCNEDSHSPSRYDTIYKQYFEGIDVLFGGYDSDSPDLCILRHIAAVHYGFGKSAYRNAAIQYKMEKILIAQLSYEDATVRYPHMQRESIASRNPYLIMLKSNATVEDYEALIENMRDVDAEYYLPPVPYLTSHENKRMETLSVEGNPSRYACIVKFMREGSYECCRCGAEFDCLPSFEIFVEHIRSHPEEQIEVMGQIAPSMADIMLEAQKLKGV